MFNWLPILSQPRRKNSAATILSSPLTRSLMLVAMTAHEMLVDHHSRRFRERPFPSNVQQGVFSCLPARRA